MRNTSTSQPGHTCHDFPGPIAINRDKSDGQGRDESDDVGVSDFFLGSLLMASGMCGGNANHDRNATKNPTGMAINTYSARTDGMIGVDSEGIQIASMRVGHSSLRERDEHPNGGPHIPDSEVTFRCGSKDVDGQDSEGESEFCVRRRQTSARMALATRSKMVKYEGKKEGKEGSGRRREEDERSWGAQGGVSVRTTRRTRAGASTDSAELASARRSCVPETQCSARRASRRSRRALPEPCAAPTWPSAHRKPCAPRLRKRARAVPRTRPPPPRLRTAVLERARKVVGGAGSTPCAAHAQRPEDSRGVPARAACASHPNRARAPLRGSLRKVEGEERGRWMQLGASRAMSESSSAVCTVSLHRARKYHYFGAQRRQGRLDAPLSGAHSSRLDAFDARVIRVPRARVAGRAASQQQRGGKKEKGTWRTLKPHTRAHRKPHPHLLLHASSGVINRGKEEGEKKRDEGRTTARVRVREWQRRTLRITMAITEISGSVATFASDHHLHGGVLSGPSQAPGVLATEAMRQYTSMGDTVQTRSYSILTAPDYGVRIMLNAIDPGRP
ncbi:hypothetical protein FB451DRAFT_1174817 [Mycena latifolia]|nr:hypothetical protein FB451DRAFT_1174817 [Mycena latifolia]